MNELLAQYRREKGKCRNTIKMVALAKEKKCGNDGNSYNSY